MKKFGKIENGAFTNAPPHLQDAKFTYFNPKEEKLKEYGFLEIVETDYPDDGNAYRKDYELKDNYILQTWVLLAESELETKTEAELLAENGDLEARISLLEAQMALILEYGDFEKIWHKHKHKPKPVTPNPKPEPKPDPKPKI